MYFSSHFPVWLLLYVFDRDESGWWLFPTGLLICKCVQARLVDWHVANLEIQDRYLYSNDPDIFWKS